MENSLRAMRQVLSAWGLDKDPPEVVAINDGLINTTWRIRHAQDEFILQKINDHIFKDPHSIAWNLRLLSNYLREKYPEYLFISPIKTAGNEEMTHLEGEGYFRLFPYVKNSHTIHAVRNTNEAFEAAMAFGRFTKLLAGFPVETLRVTLPNFHNLALRYQQLDHALLNGNHDRIRRAAELTAFIKKHQTIVRRCESMLHNPAFKLRVMHHDTKISNVLFSDDDKGLCVIDLDTVMPGYFVSDVGDMMRTYLSPVSEEETDFSKITISEDYFEAVREGYLAEMGDELTLEEKKSFVYAGMFMIYMQGIRFLTDYLNDDIYYGAKYEEHNFKRAGNQIVLLDQLLNK